MTGGDAVAKSLQALGVKAVFGIPSVHNLPTVDALGRFGTPRFIGARHEQGAAAMADGYARLSGGIGVCLTSTGPGAANTVASLFEAEVSCSPVVHITGQVPTPLLGRGKGPVHEIRDQPSMLAAVSKAVLRAQHVADIPPTLQRAAHVALSGKPGPVSVEIPIDVQYADGEFTPLGPLPLTPIAPLAAQIREAAELITRSSRVAIWVGGGAVRSGAGEAITALAERLGAPIVTSTTGRGAVDEDHPLFVGAFTTRDESVRTYLETCDLWIAIGARFRGESTDEWTLKPPKALIHVNIDPVENGRNYAADVFMAADARLATEAISKALAQGAPTADAATAYELRASARESLLSKLGPYRTVAEALSRHMTGSAVLVRDATMAAYVFGNRLIPVHAPRTSIYPAGAAIGLGLPLAIGAQAVDTARTVFAICGDGGFMLNLGELASAVQAELPVVVLLFNDCSYDVLRRAQERSFESRYTGVHLKAPDFAGMAEMFGMDALRVGSAEAFAPALEKAVALRRPVLVEIDVKAIGPIPR